MLRRRKMHLIVGTSELDGFDVGKYPLHHFVPGPGCGGELRNRLPVYIRSAGRDEWVKGCFRHRRNSDIFAVEFVVSGEFAFTRHGRRHLIGPGGIFLGHPDGGESCMEVTSDYAEKRTVIIRGAALEGVTGALNLDEVDLLRPAAPEEFNRWLDRADAFCPNGDPHEASAFTYEFLLYLSKLAGRAGLSVEIQQAPAGGAVPGAGAQPRLRLPALRPRTRHDADRVPCEAPHRTRGGNPRLRQPFGQGGRGDARLLLATIFRDGIQETAGLFALLPPFGLNPG